MNDRDCIRLLQEILPRLRMRWPGFRRVRSQVCKRIQRRMRALQLPDINVYRQYLDRHEEEWQILDECTRITISRFYRDQGVYRLLEQEILPQLIAQARERSTGEIKVWSAGCGAGEEPYSLAILWRHSDNPDFMRIQPDILATDVDPLLLQRAVAACYSYSSLKELPPPWREAAFSCADNRYCLHPEYRKVVRLLRQDIRTTAPDGPFDLVLCRNLAFTYFDAGLQSDIGQQLADVLHPGGALVLGAHEHLPPELPEFGRHRGQIYFKRTCSI